MDATTPGMTDHTEAQLRSYLVVIDPRWAYLGAVWEATELAARSPARFRVLVLATGRGHRPLGERDAHRRLDDVLGDFAVNDLDADGTVSTTTISESLAIELELTGTTFDAVLLVAPVHRFRRWLHTDLANHIQRTFGLRVIQVPVPGPASSEP